MATEGTEKPTPKRLRDAALKGDVARSPAACAAACVVVFMLAGFSILDDLPERFTAALSSALGPGRGISEAAAVFGLFKKELFLLPVVVMLACAAAGLLQTGFHVGTGRLSRFDLFNPGRVFNVQSLAAAPIVLAAGISFSALGLWLVYVTALKSTALPVAGDPAGRVFRTTIGTAAGAMWKTAAAGAVYGLFDFYLHRRRRLKRLMMTRKDISDELKESEGDPFIKSRRRRLHRQLAMNGLREGVRTARAVVVNPTRIAVALRYADGDEAPVVSCKGEGEAARIMREEAEISGVPVVRDVLLARSMYRSLDVEDEIPPELYETVARILHAAGRALADGVHFVEMEGS